MRKSFAQHLRTLFEREEGTTAVEYAALLALIVVICMPAAALVGVSVNDTFTFVSSRVALS